MAGSTSHSQDSSLRYAESWSTPVKYVGNVYDLDIDNIDFSSGTSHFPPAQQVHHKVILDPAIQLTNQASERNEGICPC